MGDKLRPHKNGHDYRIQTREEFNGHIKLLHFLLRNGRSALVGISCMLQTSLASPVPRVPDNYLTAVNDLGCLEMSGISFMTRRDFHKSRKLSTPLDSLISTSRKTRDQYTSYSPKHIRAVCTQYTHKSFTVVLLPDSPSSFYLTFGLNNNVARETQVELKPTVSPDDSVRSNSPTERLKNHVWPALKKGISTSLLESTKISRKRQDSQPSNAALPCVTFQPKQLKKAASGSLTERREIALADLGMMPMKAGQGPRMDSPTIPGRIPVRGRSNNAPGSSANQTHFERSIQEPISEPLILFSQTDLDIKKVPAKVEELRDTPRSQSAAERVRPSDLKETSFPSSEEVSEVQEEDKPPAVTPKSPRLINPSVMTTPNIGEAHLITPKGSNTSLRPQAATAMKVRPLRHVAELHRHNESTPIGTVSKIHISKPNQRTTRLKHEAGKSAIQSQDRAKRRRSLLGAGNRTSKTFAVEKTNFPQLPVGFTLPDAKSQFNSSDVEKLRKQAKIQAEKFKVLQYHEVKSLSKELRYLDARCDYLRTTSKALRAGRNQLHERVITHLRSSRSSSNSRENILDQKEALVQLDKSIDEWITKLEEVDNRRTRVRQMLLEHIAASLILSDTYDTQGSKQGDLPAIQNEVTSKSALDIEFNDVASVARESIKIYADLTRMRKTDAD